MMHCYYGYKDVVKLEYCAEHHLNTTDWKLFFLKAFYKGEALRLFKVNLMKLKFYYTI